MINILDLETISKISAGEVINNISEIIKEMVENSFDANSKNIRVYLKDYGMSGISIIDDGDGMSEEDLKKCFKSHTTSKIKDYTDLSKISTFGFRGEALYSISQACNLKIVSKIKEAISGNFIEIKNGGIINEGVVAFAEGTKIEITDIFNTLPVKKKHLKSEKKEYSTILELIENLSLSNEKVNIRLYNNGELVVEYKSFNNIKEKLSHEYKNDFILIDTKKDNFKILGVISIPSHIRKSAVIQKLFINKRIVNPKLVSKYVRMSYGELLPSGFSPSFVLFLNIPTENLDVNIHPKKDTVSILDEEDIFSTLNEEIKKQLFKSDLTEIKTQSNISYENLIITDYAKDAGGFSSNLGNYLQIHDLYLILPYENGVSIVDQHAAHERVIYEKLVNIFEKNFENYLISTNEELTLNKRELIEIINETEFFKGIGINLIKIDSEHILVKQVPMILHDKNIKRIILEIISDKKEFGQFSKVDDYSKLNLSYLACRLAIKDGEKLNQDQMGELILSLNNTKSKYTCPHGRPVRIDIPLEEIHKLFMR